MTERLDALHRGFFKSIAVLASGRGVAALIPLLAAPILSRLYAPAEYGPIAVFLASNSILSIFANLQVHHYVIAEEKERWAGALLHHQVLIASPALFCSVVTAAVFIATAGRDLDMLTVWSFCLLPLATFISARLVFLGAIANKDGQYGVLARAGIITAAATTLTSIALGFVGAPGWGLILGFTAGQLATLFVYLHAVGAKEKSLKAQRPLPWRLLLRRYREPITLSVPSQIISAVMMQAPIFLLPATGGLAAVGLFNRARQLIGMPQQVLGSGAGEVFRRDATQLWNDGVSVRPVLVRTWIVTAAISSPFLLAVLFFGPPLFALFLGEPWRRAGEFAQILAPMLMLRSMVSTTAYIFYLQKNVGLEWRLRLWSVGVLAVSLGLGIYFCENGAGVVTGFSVGYAAIYFIYGIAQWLLSSNRRSDASA